MRDLVAANGGGLAVRNAEIFQSGGSARIRFDRRRSQRPDHQFNAVRHQVAVGRLAKLSIFGNDYPTPDGTAMRDFIHVVDLAKGHLAALRALERDEKLVTVNLGTGRGASVLELVRTFTAATGAAVPYAFAARRQGDIIVSYADASRARNVLGWQAERDLAAMCRNAWNWQSRNPNGYRAHAFSKP